MKSVEAVWRSKIRGSRMVLDVGKPLWADWDEVVPLPSVPGLEDGSDPSLAVWCYHTLTLTITA